jgi:preprotein translocase subunit YajC
VKSLLPLILIVVFFYAIVLRPAQKRQRLAAQTTDSLQVGADVITTSGMLATVHAVDDKHVELEIAPGVYVRFNKAAVARVMAPEEPDEHEALDGPADGAPDSSPSDGEPRNTTET